MFIIQWKILNMTGHYFFVLLDIQSFLRKFFIQDSIVNWDPVDQTVLGKIWDFILNPQMRKT